MSRPQHTSHPDRASMNEREPPSVRVLPHLPPAEAEVPPGGERPSDQSMEARWGPIQISAKGGRTVALVCYTLCVVGFGFVTVRAGAMVERASGSLDRVTAALEANTRESEAHRRDVVQGLQGIRADIEAMRGEVRAAVSRR